MSVIHVPARDVRGASGSTFLRALFIGGRDPTPGTSLVGRDREIGEVVQLVRTGRLVTLTGPGGTGKTRLALAVAHILAEEGDELVFVDLSGVDSPDLMPACILASLGLRAVTGQPPLDLIAVQIGERDMTLLLDNFEHVLRSAPRITELLARCPHLRVLVTSRIRLQLSAEKLYDVPPLAVPPASEREEALATYGSVSLFLDRASEAGGPQALATSGLPVVAEICRRLEGLPLAIELAASRARHLSIQALLARLTEPLPLLAGGPVDAPARHRALRHTISWSYDLLAPELAAFFGDLGVFEGTFGLEAAHLVAGARVGSSESQTLDALTALADQSLLRSIPAHEESPRFVMHDAISDFAVSVLHDEGAARHRHLAYYVDLAERAEPELERADQARWTRILADDMENLRAGLRWAHRSSSGVELLRLAAALGNFWRWHGDLREGRDWLSRATLAAPPSHEALVAKAQRRAARIYSSLGERDQARLLYESARQNAEAAGDVDGVAEALLSIGGVLIEELRQAEAEPFIVEGMELARSCGSMALLAAGTLAMATLRHSQGRTSEAAPLYQEAIDIARGLGDQRFAAVALVNLADTKLVNADYAAAVPLLTEGVTDLDQTGDLAYAPWANLMLGLARRQLGALEAARTPIDRGARMALDVDSPIELIFAAEAIADWLGAAGAHRDALTSWAAASNAREDLDIPRQQTDDHWIDGGVDRDRSALTEAAATEAWARARETTLREAVTQGLAAMAAASMAMSDPTPHGRDVLTQREMEVLSLLAQGWSDQQIALELFISPKTASVHVSSIKAKLEASSRVEAVTNAVRMGLVSLDDGRRR